MTEERSKRPRISPVVLGVLYFWAFGAFIFGLVALSFILRETIGAS